LSKSKTKKLRRIHIRIYQATVARNSCITVGKICALITAIFGYYRDDAFLKPKIERCINIWEERQVFDASAIQRLRGIAGARGGQRAFTKLADTPTINGRSQDGSNGVFTSSEPTDEELFPRVTEEEDDDLQTYDVRAYEQMRFFISCPIVCSRTN
jgi:hypothetical protein